MSIINYIKETKGEMSHVRWLSRSEVIKTTVLVLVIAGFIGYALGLFDSVFAKILTKIFS